jgi:hypothetical protein
MADYNEDQGRRMRLGVEDQGIVKHRSGTRWSDDREVR